RDRARRPLCCAVVRTVNAPSVSAGDTQPAGEDYRGIVIAGLDRAEAHAIRFLDSSVSVAVGAANPRPVLPAIDRTHEPSCAGVAVSNGTLRTVGKKQMSRVTGH